MKLLRFIPFLVAFAMVLKVVIEVMSSNFLETNENISYQVVQSVQYGGIALCLVGLSIFLKRDIWAYLFFGVIVASFFPILSFTNLEVSFQLGSFKIDLIAVPLLIFHVFLNIHLVRFPNLSKVEEEDSTKERVDYFMKRFESKTDDELLRMDEKGMVPEAIEALKNMIEKRSL